MTDVGSPRLAHRAHGRGEEGRFGAVLAVAVASAVGLLLLALGNNLARQEAPGAQALFWAGLLLQVVPALWCLASPHATRRERLAVAVVLGVSLYVVKVLHSPVNFTLHDELGHLRTVTDLARSGDLFAPNPIVAVYPWYPGLAVATVAVSALTGLSHFAAGVVVIGVARVVMVTALFALVQRVTGSDRAAGIAVAAYAGNPNFLYFGAQFSYESLALPLAVVVLLLAQERRGGRLLSISLLVITAGAVAVTHHLTMLFLLAVLAAWTVADAIWSPDRRRWRSTLLAAAVTLGVAGVWQVASGPATARHIVPVLDSAADSTFEVVTGGARDKELFRSATGKTQPLTDRILGFGAVLVVAAALPFAAPKLWRLRRRSGLAVVLLLLYAAYPVSLIFRLTEAGTETSSRAAEFLFIGIAPGIGLLAARWRPRGPGGLPPARAVLPALGVLVFVGGFIVGWPPYARQPGPYLVGADPRSIDAAGMAAAAWTAENVAPSTNIATDRQSGLLQAAIAGQDPLDGTRDGLHVSHVISSPVVDDDVREVIRTRGLRYVIVDQRISWERPRIGYYFSKGEPLAFRHEHPLPIAALAKFDDPNVASRVYDNGDVVVYRLAPSLTGES